ncbi:MAG: hypothetical protein QOG56_1241 [Solirubrobacteraceae bacterium]|nr:hypothetical protein [Solirubrobacteraceae bacterium]
MNQSISISSRRVAALAACVVAGVAAAVASVSSISLVPPAIEPLALEIAGATSTVVVDRPRPLVADRLATDGDYQTLQKRAVLLANLVTSAPVLERIGRRAGVDPDEIAASTRVTANVQSVLTDPNSEKRASDIRDARRRYRIEVQPDPTLPSFTVFARAPTIAAAEALANSAVAGLHDYRVALARREHADPAKAVRLEQVGTARGAIINGGAKVVIAGFSGLCGFAAAGLALLTGARLRRHRRAGPRLAGSGPPEPREAPERSGPPPQAAVVPARLRPAGERGVAAALADWPHTTRVLPWLVALFMAMIWLVPFNVIELSVSLPIDLPLDRLVLPFIVGAWVLALAAGDPSGPRIRVTWIHLALAAMVVVACASLVIEARSLSQTLEFDTSVKKLTLLASYLSLFVVVASVVRRSEVPAFLTYTLALAVLCALGTIWEYRFKYNVFYSLSDQVLPGIFHVGAAEAAALDNAGRRVVRGPAELSLETVAMLAMGLPIALVGLVHAVRARARIGYGICAALLVAGAVATYRKSAFVAPISVFLTLAYFRRRELVRLAPLGVVMVVMIPMLAPGAVGSVAAQLSGSRLQVDTVSDRTSDYDAVRPDVWSHLMLGRGYGSYEHTSYRTLDMELLRQLVDVGVLGLAAYLLVIGAVVAVARAPIRARGSLEATVALSAAAAAVAFLVVSTLFDVMSFPHSPYIFLSIAALLAVVSAPAERPRR